LFLLLNGWLASTHSFTGSASSSFEDQKWKKIMNYRGIFMDTTPNDEGIFFLGEGLN